VAVPLGIIVLVAMEPVEVGLLSADEVAGCGSECRAGFSSMAAGLFDCAVEPAVEMEVFDPCPDDDVKEKRTRGGPNREAISRTVGISTFFLKLPPTHATLSSYLATPQTLGTFE